VSKFYNFKIILSNGSIISFNRRGLLSLELYKLDKFNSGFFGQDIKELDETFNNKRSKFKKKLKKFR
jgi:hypothetical protein